MTAETLELNVRLGPNLHAPGDGDEIIAVERLALADEGVKAAIAKLQLPEGSQIVADPWIYGKYLPVQCQKVIADSQRRRRWRRGRRASMASLHVHERSDKRGRSRLEPLRAASVDFACRRSCHYESHPN